MLLTAFSDCGCDTKNSGLLVRCLKACVWIPHMWICVFVHLHASCYSMYFCVWSILVMFSFLRVLLYRVIFQLYFYFHCFFYLLADFLLSQLQCPSFQWARIGTSKSCQILCLCDSFSVSPYGDFLHGCYPDN